MSNEGAGELSAKRQKIDDENSEFREVLKKRPLMDNLMNAYQYLCRGGEDLVFSVLEILETNALQSKGFSRASCKVRMFSKKFENSDTLLPRLYPAGTIFQDGVYILEGFLGLGDAKDLKPKLPEDLEQREALRKLLLFLNQNPERHDSLIENDKCDEAQWAVRVAQHLLLPLTVGDCYIIDDNYDGLKKILPKCPCKAGDPIHGILGDTSFGWVDGWHGRSDILVNSVPVSLAHPEVEDLEDVSSAGSLSVSSAEIKAASNDQQHEQQVLAQTIVFSFLQRKENKGNLKNCLIPGIGISKKKVVIYFYDCEEDVLLGTTQIDLFGYKNLRYSTIILLWLTLNYRLFCTGITNSMKNYKARFFNKVGGYLENYRNDVSRAVSENQKRSEDVTGWTKTGVLEETLESLRNNVVGPKLIDI